MEERMVEMMGLTVFWLCETDCYFSPNEQDHLDKKTKLEQ